MGVIPNYRKARIGLSNKELAFLVFGHTRVTINDTRKLPRRADLVELY